MIHPQGQALPSPMVLAIPMQWSARERRAMCRRKMADQNRRPRGWTRWLRRGHQETDRATRRNERGGEGGRRAQGSGGEVQCSTRLSSTSSAPGCRSSTSSRAIIGCARKGTSTGPSTITVSASTRQKRVERFWLQREPRRRHLRLRDARDRVQFSRSGRAPGQDRRHVRAQDRRLLACGPERCDAPGIVTNARDDRSLPTARHFEPGGCLLKSGGAKTRNAGMGKT